LVHVCLAPHNPSNRCLLTSPSFALRLRQLRRLSISPTPSPTQSKSPSPTPTRFHRHNRTDTDTDTNSPTLDLGRFTTIIDRHELASDSSDTHIDRLSSNTRTRRTHSFDLRSVSHAYFLTRSRLRYAHRPYRNCTETEADTRLGCRSDHRSHELIPVLSGLTSPRRRSELRRCTIRRYCGNIRR
jgi:hypothetical protein